MSVRASHLYFAYGSNLDGAQMRRRCPGAYLVGAGVLDGYRLRFAGRSRMWGGAVATVVRARSERVPGLVWALGDGDLERLDRFEGHPLSYRRRRLLVEVGERRRRAHVYRKEEGGDLGSPTDAYVGVIRRAYRHHGFDERGLALALAGGVMR